jgi:hypothetical protein
MSAALGNRGITSRCAFGMAGVRGFLAGLGAGLAGAVVLPVAGVVGGLGFALGEFEGCQRLLV